MIDAAFLSRSPGGGVTRKMHEERGRKRERKTGKGGNKTSGETDAWLELLILSVLKRHRSRLQSCTVKSTLNPSAVN